jgi:hypothetical protein
MRWQWLCGLNVALLVSGGAAVGDETRCKESCTAERREAERALEGCLRQVEPRPPDRAAKMRLLCRQKHTPPRCDELPPCVAKKATKAPVPGLRLGPMMFSATMRGAPLARPVFAAGSEVFLRLEIEVLAKPRQRRIWLQQSLRLLVVDKNGKSRELMRWDKPLEEQKFLDPAERGLPKRFTMHGAAKLPAELEAGPHVIEADVKEAVSGFRQVARGTFTAIRAKR